MLLMAFSYISSFLYKFLRIHHFFLKIVKISVIVEYNAVGVDNIARQNG